MLFKRIITAVIFLLLLKACFAQEVKYVNGNNDWNADSLGNHRVLVQFAGNGNIAKLTLPWRRQDSAINKRIIVQDAKTGKKILNVATGTITNEQGEIFFEPTSGKGAYYIYYMPYRNEGRSNYPKGVYLTPENTATPQWLSVTRPTFNNTVATQFESIDSFNSFYPMEVIATQKETAALVAKSSNKAYLVFPEDRMYPIKMKTKLPYRWAQKELRSSFSGRADKGEFFTYQLGVYALKALNNLQVKFSDLKNSTGNTIVNKYITCFNTGGIDYAAKPFTKRMMVQPGEVQALWCAVDVPQNTPSGTYNGKATITAEGAAATTIDVSITITDAVATDGDISEPWKQTRLHWLNSTMAQENTVISPYIPLQIQGNVISLLGRKITLNEDGFPSQISTFFTKEMTGYTDVPNNLLAAPVQFNMITSANGQKLLFNNSTLQFTKKEAGTVQWKSSGSNDRLQVDVFASLEFDGFISYTVKVTALQNVSLKDIMMLIPLKKDMGKYLMGLGQKGGYRPEQLDWKWDVAHKNQDGAWIGTVNAGLQYSLRDDKYVRPLNTNFYLQKPLLLPDSWGNNNKGGISIGVKDTALLVNNYSGERTMQKGDTLFYNFTLLITPFHPLNTNFQWATRFFSQLSIH